MSNLSKYEKLLYKHNRLKRHCGNQMNKIVEYKQKLQRKDNNWNELKKYVDKLYEDDTYHSIGEVLDKIEELENDIK